MFWFFVSWVGAFCVMAFTTTFLISTLVDQFRR